MLSAPRAAAAQAAQAAPQATAGHCAPGLAFSLMVSEAEVCCTKKLARPTSSSASSGSCMGANATTKATPDNAGHSTATTKSFTRLCNRSSSTRRGAREQLLLLVYRPGAACPPAGPACHPHSAAGQSMHATPCTRALRQLSAGLSVPEVCAVALQA